MGVKLKTNPYGPSVHRSTVIIHSGLQIFSSEAKQGKMREMGKFQVEALGQGFQITWLFETSTGTNTPAKLIFVNLRPDQYSVSESHISFEVYKATSNFLNFSRRKADTQLLLFPPYCFHRLFSLLYLLPLAVAGNLRLETK